MTSITGLLINFYRNATQHSATMLRIVSQALPQRNATKLYRVVALVAPVAEAED